MWRPRSRPIALIIVAEFAATPRPSTRAFQTLSMGRIGQAGAPGTVGDGSLPTRWVGVRSPVMGLAADADPADVAPTAMTTIRVSGHERLGRRRRGVGMRERCPVPGPGRDG